MEIGYETQTDHVRDVLFEDIDVLGVHEHGSVFGIHNGDHALVEHVEWNNIRVEHHYDKLVDFRVLNSRWNKDPERGLIRDVTLRDISVTPSIYNPGYTLSVIAGYDKTHDVSQVHFERFHLGSKHILSPDALDLVTRHAHDVTFS